MCDLLVSTRCKISSHSSHVFRRHSWQWIEAMVSSQTSHCGCGAGETNQSWSCAHAGFAHMACCVQR